MELTEKLDCSSAVALLGFTLILAILRAFNVRDEAGRVMIAAPVLAFVTTHILYLNFYKLDYGINLLKPSIMILYVVYLHETIVWSFLFEELWVQLFLLQPLKFFLCKTY